MMGTAWESNAVSFQDSRLRMQVGDIVSLGIAGSIINHTGLGSSERVFNVQFKLFSVSFKLLRRDSE